MANAKNKYVLEGSHAEVERLQKQHLWFQSTLKNQIVFAPVDLKQPGFRVLDVGCADGMESLLYTRGRIIPMS
jgi:2-polyprenyl-3-methyl-5-hydroxy-6-metoxy-1,4-benzoquinol methylase